MPSAMASLLRLTSFVFPNTNAMSNVRPTPLGSDLKNSEFTMRPVSGLREKKGRTGASSNLKTCAGSLASMIRRLTPMLTWRGRGSTQGEKNGTTRSSSTNSAVGSVVLLGGGVGPGGTGREAGALVALG